MLTQEEAVHEYLLTGKSLTRLEALEMFKTLEMPRIAWDLRQLGVPIKSEMVRSGNKRYAKYFLEIKA